jgi:cytochrome c biogenesis protein CcdA/thiol-disulfide isomerase/thioredoxin
MRRVEELPARDAATWGMATYVLAFLGGLLTILSPCVLPIVPLVFSHAGQSVRQRVLMLTGLTLTFALTAAAANAGLAWAIALSDAGRWIALAFLGVVALTLLSEPFAVWIARPFVRIGASLDGTARRRDGALGSVLSGAAIGFLWAPCAGPILGLVLASGRASGSTLALPLLLTFGIGAGTALAVVLVAGAGLTRFLRRSLSMDRFVRRTLGTLALAGVMFIALGWDRALLAKGNFVQTAAAEELLVKRLAPTAAARPVLGESLDAFAAESRVELFDEGAMPEFASGREWINSVPLTKASLQGKVVLVDFWTFDCINCRHALPYVKALYAKYKDQGFVVVGVHTPELARERVPANVRKAITELGVTYPVVIDGDYAIWNAWNNQYWPAAYFVDATGHVRFHNFGEGRYDEQDAVVKKLLAEAHAGR